MTSIPATPDKDRHVFLGGKCCCGASEPLDAARTPAVAETLDVERLRARHIEPHECPREGPWAACDFNRAVAQ